MCQELRRTVARHERQLEELAEEQRLQKLERQRLREASEKLSKEVQLSRLLPELCGLQEKLSIAEL